ncbi:HlyD family efflux transporter periplasmic adaptor subunit [Mucilaginibacter sp. HMF5004]|uniref:efflux RND transporter periplasmic adaptor subunit n=1 Tax=Mucilaginibacter rivuli TaxID=2857527 RepID=UPI001C5D1A9F|nr:HlyD family efflux transporter periplasmic adaptor subunit [Mucilaginibacter rivuli]MBW4889633.1 HlyD family efflux transporter periplasmic adaptor subunit [Mucilaginibacter rivuli]
MHKDRLYILGLGVLFIQAACTSAPPAEDAAVESTPVVTVGNPANHSFSNSVTFTGTTQYQQKAVIRAGIAGYVHHRGWKMGDVVRGGSVYCTITSKEQEALKNIDKSGILEKFRNPIPVVAGTGGILTAVNYQNGDFVAEGDILATLTQQSSLVLLVNVPVEYLSKVHAGTACTVVMPDGTKLSKNLQAGLPTADPASQTQSFIVPIASTNLPEGANLKVVINLSTTEQGLAVPVKAVQTDETQEHFWIFKLGADGKAYKIEVQAGKISTDSLQEIQAKGISTSDKIILDGAYGLADSSKVKLAGKGGKED